MVYGHLISMNFPQVDGWSMDPQVLVHHKIDLLIKAKIS